MIQKQNKFPILWAADTNPGVVRLQNEDFFWARPDLGLWIVCDGLGGHCLGEHASRICARTIARSVAKGGDLKSSIFKAHDAVWRMGRNRFNTEMHPGSTVAALLIRKKEWQVAWVGDSRIWLYDRPGFKQVTRDHTVSRQLVEWGLISKEEALGHPFRNKLTHAVGIQKEISLVGYTSGRWHPNQLFLLATDGLAYWDEPQKLAMILGNARSPSHAVWLLKRASLKERGEDNVTIAIVGSPKHIGTKNKLIKNVPFLFAWNNVPQSVKWKSEY